MTSRGVALGCSSSGAIFPREIPQDLLVDILNQKLLNDAEVKALYKRFRCIAPTGWLDKVTFRESMGVIGLTDDPFIADRMFEAFGTDQKGQLYFREFATSLAVMLRGTEDEKLRLSFNMVAGGDTVITKDSFRHLVRACNAVMASLAAPMHGPSSDEEVDRLFEDLASFCGDVRDGEAVLTLQAYKAAAQGNEDFLSCLGLCPTTWRRHSLRGGRTSLWSPVQSPRLSSIQRTVLPSFDRLESQQAPAEGQTAVPTAALEELHERIETLSRMVHDATTAARASATDLLRLSSDTIADAHPTLLGRRKRADEEARKTAADEGGKPAGEVASSLSLVTQAWMAKTLSIPWSRCVSGPNTQELEEISTQEIPPLDDRRSTTASLQQSATCTSEQASVLDRIEAELQGIQGLCDQFSERASVGGVPGVSVPSPPPSPRSPSGQPPAGNQALRETTHLVPALGRTKSLSPRRHSPSGRQRSRSPNPPPQPKAHRGVSTTLRRHPNLLGPKKGLAVHFGHENWNMVVSMMIGLRLSIGRARNERRREMQPVDFTMKEKFTIAPRSANIFDATASTRHDKYRFIDYAPMVFQRIRQNLGIQPEDYLHSVGPEQLVGNMILGNLSSLSEQTSEGKSGAFFYYTADGKYMLKTVSRGEYHVLKRMLRSYWDHLRQNPNTLVVRFLGLHCLSVMDHLSGTENVSYSAQKMYFVVMANMFNTPMEIHRKYDLKGSWVGRTASDDSSTAVKKDVDFEKDREKIHVGGDMAEKLIEQIKADTKFLSANGIIDYSLLLGIHFRSSTSDGDDQELRRGMSADSGGRPPNRSFSDLKEEMPPLHQRHWGGMLSSDKKRVYFLGIIDMFKTYDTKAKIEHHAKAVVYERAGVSCCAPEVYANRFNKFMEEAIVPEAEDAGQLLVPLDRHRAE